LILARFDLFRVSDFVLRVSEILSREDDLLSLRVYTYRAMQQRPGRSVLTMLSIVIGVTAAVAVGLGTATTRNAYKQMFALVTGRATLEVNGKGGAAFDGGILAEVEKVAGIEAATPIIERPARMTVGEDKALRVQLLGIDPERDQKVRDYKIVEGRQVQDGDELVIEQGFAEYIGIKLGDTVRVTGTNVRGKEVTVVGLFGSQQGAAVAQMSMGFVPLSRAQAYFNNRRSGVSATAIDKIQVVTAANVDPAKIQPGVAALLPEGVQVHRPAASTQLMQETLLSTEQGLTLTTAFSLLMAAFIILNTFLMNVSERRRQLSILRAIGAKRNEVSYMLLREALLLGVVGTIIGLGLGVALAFLGTFFIGRAFEVQLPALRDVMTPKPFITGTVFGLLMAVVGAVVPAYLAGQVSPLEGMNRVAIVRKWNFTRLFLVLGSLLTIGSLVLIYLCILGRLPIEGATYFAVTLLIGVVLLDMTILAPQAAFVAMILKWFSPVEAGMALRQVLRNPMRSGLTVAVLFIAGSTGVGMASSILDCVRDVHDWFNQAITGDYFIRAMMPDMATGTAADLPEGLGEELTALASAGGKKRFNLEAAAFVEAKVPKGADPADALNVIVVAREYNDPDRPPSFDLVSGDPTKLRGELLSGQVVIGSVLSQKLNLKLGDKLPLETKEGVEQVPICGVANEYMVGGLAVHTSRDFAKTWLGAEGVDGYGIRAAEGEREKLKPELEALAKKYDVILLSQGDVRKSVDQFVSGTEWSLWLLVLTGFVVGAFGVVNTLTMNVLEQTRELGLLRIVAMTKKQVRRTIVMQALIIGGVALPPGILLGVGVAYVINLAMMPSFGHPVDFNLYPNMLLGTLFGALLIVLVSAIIPARRATRINLVDALHYE
jgi:putative ABC transport system permease protein